MPRRAGVSGPGGVLRASGAGGIARVEGRACRAAVRTASLVRRTRAGRGAGSGSQESAGAFRRARQVHADPPVSFERVRSLRDCRGRATWLRAWKPGSRSWPDRWWNRLNSCASTPGRRWRRAPRACRFRVTAGSPERTLSSDEVSAIRARIIEGMRKLGYEFARVSTRRTRPGGWAKRRSGPLPVVRRRSPQRPFYILQPGLRPRVENCARTRDIYGLRSSSATAECVPCAALDTEQLRRDKRKLDYRSRREFEREWGGPASPMGCRPHCAGGRRRRGVRLGEHAQPCAFVATASPPPSCANACGPGRACFSLPLIQFENFRPAGALLP